MKQQGKNSVDIFQLTLSLDQTKEKIGHGSLMVL
jgi:hypothetical protein